MTPRLNCTCPHETLNLKPSIAALHQAIRLLVREVPGCIFGMVEPRGQVMPAMDYRVYCLGFRV